MLLGVVRVLWLARLWQLGLVRVYPYLRICLGVSSVVTLGGGAAYVTLGKMSQAYGWLWAVAQLVLWTLSFGVIAEAYDHMLRGYARLQKLDQARCKRGLGCGGSNCARNDFRRCFRIRLLGSVASVLAPSRKERVPCARGELFVVRLRRNLLPVAHFKKCSRHLFGLRVFIPRQGRGARLPQLHGAVLRGTEAASESPALNRGLGCGNFCREAPR